MTPIDTAQRADPVTPADPDSREVPPDQADPSLTDVEDVAKALNVDPAVGLSDDEAQRRLEQFGRNELASGPKTPKWKKFLQQFQDPLVYLLLAATLISLVAWFIERANAQPGAEGGEALPFDAIVIVLILIVNAVLGYLQEAKAEQAVDALAKMTAPQTSVLRGGKGQPHRHVRGRSRRHSRAGRRRLGVGRWALVRSRIAAHRRGQPDRRIRASGQEARHT
jgi:magnesium-transporting ATPase (P-type)